MIRSTTSMVSNFVTGALGPSVTKKVAEISDTEEEKLPALLQSVFIVNAVTLFLFALIIIYLSSWIVDTFFLEASNLTVALYIAFFLLTGSTLSFLTQNILIGFERFKNLAHISIIVSVISIPVILLMINAFELYGALVGVSLYFILDFTLKYLFLKSLIKHINFKTSLNNIVQASQKLISFSFPLILSLIISSGTFWYAKVVVLNTSHDFSEIAIFDAAYQWITIIMLITGSTTSVALPMLSKAFGSKDNKEVSKVFYLNLVVNIGISVSIATLFIIFSKEIMSLYGEKYVRGSNVLILLSLTSIMFSISSIYNRYMITHNKVWVIFVATLFGMVALFYVLYILMHLKIVGLAWAFFSYYSTTILIYLITVFYSKFKRIIII